MLQEKEQSIISAELEKVRHENSPIIPLIDTALAAIPLVVNPLYGIAATAIYSSAKYFLKKDRLFFSELNSGLAHLSPGEIKNLSESPQFLHFLLSSLLAARKAHSEEKIRRFARMLANGVCTNPSDVDEFDELMRVMDSLSDREWHVLLIIQEFLPDFRRDIHHNEWDACLKKLEEGTKLELNQLGDLFSRLEALGCLTINGNLMAGPDASFKNPRPLSKTFYRLKALVREIPSSPLRGHS